ncbi:MAG: hypothetical protein LPK02_07020 [Rhodobacterales bacterium]|nr:hypothetical protein [Rhodobacterales bacterium]
MKPLDAQERKLIDRILRQITPRARADYLAYKRSNGFIPNTVAEVGHCASLYAKGWLDRDFDIALMQPLYLTHEAWNRFALDEWQQIEESILEEKRGDISGSW